MEGILDTAEETSTTYILLLAPIDTGDYQHVHPQRLVSTRVSITAGIHVLTTRLKTTIDPTYHHDISLSSPYAEHSLRHYTLQRHEPQGPRQVCRNHGILHTRLQRTLRGGSRDEQTYTRRHNIRENVSLGHS